jgi:alpha/beta hydrolase family protein
VNPAFVLVPSLLLGPLTWAAVAARLAASGRTTVVPSLVNVTDVDDPPFWPRVAATVDEAVAQLPQGQPIVVVAHSNAGLFVPVVVDAARRPVVGCLFVDARLPARTGPTPAASPERLAHLRTMVSDGRLPRWTQWWDADDVARLFPDPQTGAAVSAQQPRLPLSYYEQRIPVPAGWDDRPCGYLLFGPPYDRAADESRDRGWDVDEVSGGHLHQLVDPDAVAARIVAMTGRWLSSGRLSRCGGGS